MANLLVDIQSTTGGTAPSSWDTVPDLSATGITVQGTGSVLLLVAHCAIAAGSDTSAEFRFYVNGSATGSPVAHAFSDDTGSDEAGGCAMIWAIDGLSGSSNSFVVQWQDHGSSGGGADLYTTEAYSFQVIEIPSGAEIIVDESVTNGGSSPATEGSLMGASSVAVDGTGSILLMLATVPMADQVGDSTVGFRFAVDSSVEGPRTFAENDQSGENHSGECVHVVTGLSAGNHDFDLYWQTMSGGQSQHTTYSGIFQVIEITANATLHYNTNTTAAWTMATSGYNNDSTLDTDETIASGSLLLALAACAKLEDSGDRNIRFTIGIDDANAGGLNQQRGDGTTMYNGGIAVHAESGLSSGSHSFQLRGQRSSTSTGINTNWNRELSVIEFTTAGGENYALAGIIAATSGASASIQYIARMVGSTAGVSSASGSIVATYGMVASTAGASTVSGTLTKDVIELLGSVAGSSGVSGTLTKDVIELLGTVGGTSAISGSIIANYLMNGNTAGTSAVSGTFTKDVIELIGSTAGTSSVAGELIKYIALVGTVAGTSSVSGTLTKDVIELIGSLGASSNVSGTLTKDVVELLGTIAALSTVTGDLTLGGVLYELAGTIAALSTAGAGLKYIARLLGSVASQSTATAGLTATYNLAGSIDAVSSVTGNLSHTVFGYEPPGSSFQTFYERRKRRYNA